MTMTETTKSRTNGKGTTQAAKTHCPHGHPYSGDNLIILRVKDRGEYTGATKRQCRECKKNSHRGIRAQAAQ